MSKVTIRMVFFIIINSCINVAWSFFYWEWEPHLRRAGFVWFLKRTVHILLFQAWLWTVRRFRLFSRCTEVGHLMQLVFRLLYTCLVSLQLPCVSSVNIPHCHDCKLRAVSPKDRVSNAQNKTHTLFPTTVYQLWRVRGDAWTTESAILVPKRLINVAT